MEKAEIKALIDHHADFLRKPFYRDFLSGPVSQDNAALLHAANRLQELVIQYIKPDVEPVRRNG